jgi:cobalt/nickel transport system ATP-binding protein
LLDEPSNALDKAARLRLIEVLQALPQAMIIISHESTFLDALVTRRTRLESGKVFDI